MTTVIELQPTAPPPRASAPDDLAPDLTAPCRPTRPWPWCVPCCASGRSAIAAVICAGHVRTRLALGDLEGARRASRRTLRLCCASAMVTMFYVLVIVLGADGYSHVH